MSFDSIAVTSHFLCILQMTHHFIFYDNDKVQCLGVEKLVEEDVITHEESRMSVTSSKAFTPLKYSNVLGKTRGKTVIPQRPS